MGARPTVSPPILINHNTNFSESESMSGLGTDTGREDRTNDNMDNGPNHDGDPFVTGTPSRAKRGKKKRQKNDDVTLAAQDIKEVLQGKWQIDGEKAEELRQEERERYEEEKRRYQEEKEDRHKLLNVMERSVQSMTDLNGILQSLIEKRN